MAGSRKGVKNKKSFSAEETALRLGFDVVEGLINFAEGNWKKLGYDNEVYVSESASGSTKIGYTITPEMRLTAHKELMKYLHSQKKAVEISTSEEGIKIEIVDYTSKK